MTKRITLITALATLATATIAPTATTARASEQLPLNGPWQIAFDDHNTGKRDQWHIDANLTRQKLHPITVPSSWETIRADYEGVAWYRTQFDAPAHWRGKSIRLHFDASSYLTEVWLNDELVDYHEGAYDPFEFPIDNLVHYGKPNTLILRVISPIVRDDTLTIDGMAKWEAPHWRGALIAGVWQDACIKVTEKTYIKDLFIEPALDGAVKLNLIATNSGTKNRPTTITCAIRHHTENQTHPICTTTETHTLEPGDNTLTLHTRIPSSELKLWTPDTPHLYDATLTITTDTNETDTHTTRFGVREFTLTPAGFHLNGKPLYMKAGFWEGLYPVGLALPDTPEMLRKEITLAKQAHFNTLRPWRKPPVPWLLDMADELGILMIGAPALECMNEKPAIAGQMNRRVFHEIEAMVRRDRNHPSIIMWELFNEVKRDAIGRLKHESCLRARAIDPTRLIIDESGGWADGCKAYLPRSREPQPFNEIHTYEKAPVRDTVYDRYQNLASPDQKASGWSKLSPGAISIVSEVGYGSLSDLEADMRAFRAKGNPLAPTYTSHEKLHTSLKKIMPEAGLDEIFGDISQLALASQQVQSDGNKLMLEALRLNPNLSGYCIHAYTDGDWVIGAGVLDIWRNPKLQYEMLKTANAPLYISARVEPANIVAGHKVRIKSALVSEHELPQKGTVTLTLATATGNPLWTKTLPANAPRGITPVINETITIPAGTTGQCTLTATFTPAAPMECGDLSPLSTAGLVTPPPAIHRTTQDTSGGLTSQPVKSGDKSPHSIKNAANTFTCHVFPPITPADIKPPRPLVVIGESKPAGQPGKKFNKNKSPNANSNEGLTSKLTTWLDKHGVPYSEKLPDNLNKRTPTTPAPRNGDNTNISRRSEAPSADILPPLILTNINNPTEDELNTFRAIFKKVEQGAILVMFHPPTKNSTYKPADPPKEETITTQNRFHTSGVFPINLVGRTAKGNWISNNHAIAPAHPYFDGLPSKCFMGQLYANIAPMVTMVGLREKPIVSSLSWLIDRSYLGVKEAWWGSDLVRVPHGKGAIILSTLSLIPNLDTDPVAAIVLKNIINNTK